MPPCPESSQGQPRAWEKKAGDAYEFELQLYSENVSMNSLRGKMVERGMGGR